MLCCVVVEDHIVYNCSADGITFGAKSTAVVFGDWRIIALAATVQGFSNESSGIIGNA
jgi:hypothetical protein